MPVADVERIIQQHHVVRPHIQAHRQAVRRVDAGRCRVQRELADGYSHAAGTLVSQTENPLVVGGDDQPDILMRDVLQHVRNALDIVGSNPDSPRMTEDVAELLAGTSHRRRIHDRQQLGDVLDQQAIEQGLIAIFQRGQADVLLQVVVLRAEVLELQRHLLVNRQLPRWQQSLQAERLPLFRCECGIFVM